MKAKRLNILFASVFALIFLIGFASALTLSSSTTSLSQDGGSFSLTLSNAGSGSGSLAYSVKDSSGTVYTGFSFNQASYTGNTTLSVTYAAPTDFNFVFKEVYTVTITATETSGTATKSIPFADSDFCESVANHGNLKTTVEDVKVINGFGDDNDWFLFDEIEVELLIQNNGDEDVDNIAVEWGLYDVQSKEWTIEVNDETDFDLNSDDEETVMIILSLNDKLDEDLQDLDEGDYVLYVRATGEITDGTYNGNDTCSSDSETNSLTLEKDFVVLSNIEVPETVQCNSEIQILADVWNIGSRDQNAVYVNVYNKELNIDQDVDVGDIDSFDSSDFIFNLQLPKEVQEKRYYLTFTVYDDNDDVYENGDNDKSVFNVLLNVTGDCSLAKATVSAVLESGGEAGRPLVVKATITNTGDKTNTYLLNAAGYTEWASSATIDKGSLTLDAGKSGDVLLTFNVKKEALGVKLFNIEVLSGNELVVSQPVQVDITKKTFGFGWAGIKEFFSGNNKYIWGIAILNLILIVLIIVIAVRVSRKN